MPREISGARNGLEWDRFRKPLRPDSAINVPAVALDARCTQPFCEDCHWGRISTFDSAEKPLTTF